MKIKNIIIFTLFLISHNLYGNSFQKAARFYVNKNYAQAAAEFYISNNRGIKKNKSIWGLSQSLYNLKLPYSASKYLSLIVKKGGNKNNPFFRKAFEGLGNINFRSTLGQSHIVQLFKFSIKPSEIPGTARGFYFYYKGKESFSRTKYNLAIKYFNRVQTNSKYHLKALFHLAIIDNIKGNSKQAIETLQRIKQLSNSSQDGKWMREQANINLARIKYENRQFKDAIYYYSLVPKNSDNWLQAVFESAWGFYLISKGGNTLGNIHTIHAPFFKNRFYPESYILQAITFLKYCRYDEVKKSLKEFKKRYAPVLRALKSLLNRYQNDSKIFFNLSYKYKIGTLKQYQNATPVFDFLSRTDSFKQASKTIELANKEIAILSRAPSSWKKTGLTRSLQSFIAKKKSVAVADAGNRMRREALNLYKYLIELSDQTRLITAELLLGKVDNLRRNLNLSTVNKKGAFIGGMKEFKVGQNLEYWPFNGEYWEDELGGYVFNIASLCKKSKTK